MVPALTEVCRRQPRHSWVQGLVRKAQALAGNIEALARIRTTLRQRMQMSVLSDAKRFAGQVERAYGEMWLAWVRSVGGEETVGSDQTLVESR